MNNPEKLLLIEGVFSNEEAKEILINIFSSKINFHQFKNFSSQERFGKDDATALIRIPQLKQELERLKMILSEAKNRHKRVKIHSEILISLSDD